jgi:hypothetical protein
MNIVINQYLVKIYDVNKLWITFINFFAVKFGRVLNELFYLIFSFTSVIFF